MAIVKRLRPELIIEGEMQADAAVEPHIASADYPWSKIQGDANVLIFPNLDSANAAYKLLMAPRRRRSDRPDSARDGQTGTRAAARRRRERHREHGRDRGGGRAGRTTVKKSMLLLAAIIGRVVDASFRRASGHAAHPRSRQSPSPPKRWKACRE